MKAHGIATAPLLIRLFLACCLLPGPLFAVAADGMDDAATVTTVIVVRHAEKRDSDDPDPALNEAGQARARALAAALSGVELDAVFATQYRRTRTTAEPAAEANGVTVRTVPVNSDNLGSYGDRLRQLILGEHRGGVVLVVGHSNTVPGIVQAFAGETVAPLSESSYDRLFVVLTRGEDEAELLRLRYGRPSP